MDYFGCLATEDEGTMILRNVSNHLPSQQHSITFQERWILQNWPESTQLSNAIFVSELIYQADIPKS